MNTEQYTYLLEHPDKITAEETASLRDIIDAFPFFQSAQALYLKGLKNQESFAYNKALKKTACHTSDRAVLFDYITSERFLQNDVSTQIKDQETALRNLIITDIEDVSTILDEEEQAKASKILDPDLFVEKVDSEMTRARAEETLQVGKPLPFTKTEAHSFSEWLQLAAFKPIDRSLDEQTSLSKKEIKETSDTPTLTVKTPTAQPTIKEDDSRERKRKIIDTFIESNPKISAIKPAQSEKKKVIKELPYSSESLMTETLARVYVEQKNFKKAKQAYRILSLKYPEKSGFFADQIRAVEQLEEQKD